LSSVCTRLQDVEHKPRFSKKIKELNAVLIQGHTNEEEEEEEKEEKEMEVGQI
jgi:hypothetical protein